MADGALNEFLAAYDLHRRARELWQIVTNRSHQIHNTLMP